MKKSRKEIKRGAERGYYYRLSIAFVLMLFIAAFIHFREIAVQTVEVDTNASGYIVAQVDFSFPDPDETLVLRQEALRDVGRIWKIDDREITRMRHKFENYLIHHPNWRKAYEATFEEMYKALDSLDVLLQEATFTDSRTLKKREEMGLSIRHFYTVSSLDSDRLNTLPGQFWDKLFDQLVYKKGFPENVVDFVIDYFKKVKWKVNNDIDSQRLFKQLVEKQIPERYTNVKAGTQILSTGDRVTPRHVAMIAAMKQALRDSKGTWSPETILGAICFAIILLSVGGLFFYFRKREIFVSVRKLGLYATVVVLVLIFAKLVELFILYSNLTWLEYFRVPIIVPFVSILLTILLTEGVALFTSLYLTVVIGISLAVDHNYFLFMNLVTGTVASLTSKHLKKRKEVFVVCAKIWLAAAFVIFSYNLVHNSLLTYFTLIDFALAAANLIVIAILLIGLLPVIETLFNIMTDMALMEYVDPTNPLLKRLSMEAPGTYQHSLAIGHISEYVAYSIGANGILCRVTTLYHDVGKLNNPHYYVENQMLTGQKPFNIHQLLTPTESAYIIKSHVHDGEALAKQYKLPSVFIDMIREHHGTTLIKFFYAKHVDEVGGNPDDVDEAAFRYPGPKPQSKESAIVMIADSCEAASRTLEDNAEETVRSLVNKIVADKIDDGQFDECPLTFKELSKIKQKLVEMIIATHHHRVKYPEIKKK